MPTVKEYQKDNDRRKQAYDYFISKGYSPQASAGIVGNLVYESGLNTSIEGDIGFKGGSSFGTAQWRGERLKRLKEKYGNKWSDFNNQLDFVDWELRNTHKNAGTKLQNVQTAHEAGQVFSDYYEIPKKKYHENEGRRLAVERIRQEFIKPTNDQTENINNKTINFEEPNDLTNFEDYQTVQHTRTGKGLPTIIDIEEEAPKEQESTSKEKEALLQRQREYEFLQDFSQGNIEIPRVEEPQQRVEVPQIDPLQEYQEISAFIENPMMQEGGRIPISRNGVHEYPNQKVIIPSNNISMKGVDYPILGIGDNGEQKIMLPNLDYYFHGAKNVLEVPLKK